MNKQDEHINNEINLQIYRTNYYEIRQTCELIEPNLKEIGLGYNEVIEVNFQ